MSYTFTRAACPFVNSKGVEYFLHSREVKMRGGRMQRIYYFSKSINGEFAFDHVPPGMHIKEMHNGLPILKKT